MNIIFVAMILGAAAAALGVIALAFLLPRRSCPKCRTLLPRFRKPGDTRQAMLGGWTCPGCATQINRDGSLRAES